MKKLLKFFKNLLRPKYTGPTVEEIAKDMKLKPYTKSFGFHNGPKNK